MGLMDWNQLNTNAQQGDFGAALAGYGAGADRVSQGFNAGKQLGDDLNKDQARAALANVYAAGDNHDAHNAAMMANSTGLAYADPQQLEGLRLFGMGGDTHANSAATTANTQALTAGTQADTQKKNLLMPLVVPHEQATIGEIRARTAEAGSNAALSSAQANRYNLMTPGEVSKQAMTNGEEARRLGAQVQADTDLNGGQPLAWNRGLTIAVNRLNGFPVPSQSSTPAYAAPVSDGGGGYAAPVQTPARMADTNAPSDFQQSLVRRHPTPQQIPNQASSGGGPRAAVLQGGIQTPTVNPTAPTPAPPTPGGGGLNATANSVSNGTPLQGAPTPAQPMIVGNGTPISDSQIRQFQYLDGIANNGNRLNLLNAMAADPKTAAQYTDYNNYLNGKEQNNVINGVGDIASKLRLDPKVLDAAGAHYKRYSDASEKTANLLALHDNLNAVDKRGLDTQTLVDSGKVDPADADMARSLVPDGDTTEGRALTAKIALLAHDQKLNRDTRQWSAGAILSRAAQLGLIGLDKDHKTQAMRQQEYEDASRHPGRRTEAELAAYKQRADPSNFRALPAPDYAALQEERQKQSDSMNMLGTFLTKVQILKDRQDQNLPTKVPDSFSEEYKFLHMSPKDQQSYLDHNFNYDDSKLSLPTENRDVQVAYDAGNALDNYVDGWGQWFRGDDFKRRKTGETGVLKSGKSAQTKEEHPSGK